MEREKSKDEDKRGGWNAVRVGEKKHHSPPYGSPPPIHTYPHRPRLQKVMKGTYTDVMSKLVGGNPVTISVAPRIVPIKRERVGGGGDLKKDMRR